MSKRFVYTVAMAAALLFSANLSSCRKAPTNTSTSGLSTIVCDESFQNIMDQEIDVFEYTNPRASIIPYYDSEKACIDSLLDFKTKTIIVARELTQKEKDYIKSHKKNVKSSRIAVDAIAVIVNPSNPVELLSVSEIADILTGRTTQWSELGPGLPDKEIQVVFDNEGSSTVQFMRDSVMMGQDFGANVYAQHSNQEVFAQVQSRKNAIGIIGVSWISADMRTRDLPREERIKSLQQQDTTVADFDAKVKVLKVRPNDQLRAYKPYQAYIYDGSYPLYRSIYMITTAVNGSLANGFYSFVTGTIGQKIIQRTGILPARVQPRMVNLN